MINLKYDLYMGVKVGGMYFLFGYFWKQVGVSVIICVDYQINVVIFFYDDWVSGVIYFCGVCVYDLIVCKDYEVLVDMIVVENDCLFNVVVIVIDFDVVQ